MSLRALLFTAIAAVFVAACGPKTVSKSESKTTMKPYSKKYTNADYYKDGKIQPEIVKKAYLDMLEGYGVPYTPTLASGIWMTDFSLGDFENVGMAGIFWVNDSVNSYFGHEIYLLPGQMIPEHFHVASKFPAKYESWRVTHGSCYNFGIGDPTANPPQLPASQKNFITSLNFVYHDVDEVVSLKKVESPHFLFAGESGAIVAEYATYHDGAGLRFTNPNIVFNNVLQQN